MFSVISCIHLSSGIAFSWDELARLLFYKQLKIFRINDTIIYYYPRKTIKKIDNIPNNQYGRYCRRTSGDVRNKQACANDECCRPVGTQSNTEWNSKT